MRSFRGKVDFKYLGMFVQRAQNSNVHYFVSDEPMSPEEWEKEFVTKN